MTPTSFCWHTGLPLSKTGIAQLLLMGRRLCATVPILPALLSPALPDGDAVMLKAGERKTKDVQRYNLRHCAKHLNRLTPGQDVWVTDQGAARTVVRKAQCALIRWRDPTGTSGETVVISSLGTPRRSRATVLRLNSSQKVSQNNFQ